MAIEIVDLPMKHGDVPVRYVAVYQRLPLTKSMGSCCQHWLDLGFHSDFLNSLELRNAHVLTDRELHFLLTFYNVRDVLSAQFPVNYQSVLKIESYKGIRLIHN